MKPTPETDAETMRDEYDHVDTDLGPFAPSDTVPADFARRLERERDEARAKIKRQAERIRELEGATNHAGGMKKIESIKYHGTDETDAMVELWESCHLPADFARRMEAERNEARRLADTRLDQLEAITSSEPKDYLGLVYACKSHRKHIAQLIKERDEARAALEYIAHSGLSARFLEDYAREFLKSRGGAK